MFHVSERGLTDTDNTWGEHGVSAERVLVDHDLLTGWERVDATPASVSELAEQVYESGEVGRSYYEFAHGLLWEVVMDRAGAVPRVSVAHRGDNSTLSSGLASLKAMAAIIAAAAIASLIIYAVAGVDGRSLGGPHAHMAARHADTRDSGRG